MKQITWGVYNLKLGAIIRRYKEDKNYSVSKAIQDIRKLNSKIFNFNNEQFYDNDISSFLEKIDLICNGKDKE